MQFGIMVPTFSWSNLDYGTAAQIKRFAQRAETLGFDALWVCEHVLTAPGLYGSAWLSPLLCLSHMAHHRCFIRWTLYSRRWCRLGCA
jgi:alkanesulfonate monooxygenase SsuD/methylene tetrahydromethanopterin reductase-like flavin-dependent oxidoreductase (luciferase family)